MESVHCYSCYKFPSKTLKFYVSNCMHIFCEKCKAQCEADELNPSKCTECKKTNIRILEIGPGMPEQVKQMFTPINQDFQKMQTNMTRQITFQNKQRASLIAGLTKKEVVFDKLRTAHNQEKKMKEMYKKELDQAQELISQQEAEIFQLKAGKPDDLSEIRVFTDSMYNTPTSSSKSALPDFLRSKSAKDQMEMFKTPITKPKTALGFVTPLNPPHFFPHLSKKSSKKHGSQ